MPIKSLFFNLGKIFIVSIGIVIVIWGLSKHNHNKTGDFIRIFPIKKIELIAKYDFNVNSYRILELTENQIFLGNPTAQSLIVSANHSLRVINYDTLRFTGPIDITNSFMKHLDFPHLFLFNKRIPGLYVTDLPSTSLEFKALQTPMENIDFVSISKESFAFRTIDLNSKEVVLAKQSYQDSKPKTFPNLLEKQIDGVFCTDGMLIKNRESQELLYVYYYRNQYLRLDTNMNLIGRGKSIDTITNAQISVSTLDNGKIETMGKPPIVINSLACSADSLLFIKSPRISLNENVDQFRKGSIIDVYSIPNNRYLMSLYLSNPGRKKLRQFCVRGNTLVALFDKHLLSYRLSL